MKALIVDDEPRIVEVVELCFKILAPEVTILSAADASSALKLIRKEHLDLIILDIGLPDRSGFDVLREVRSFSQVPVIILTVKGEEADRVRGLELGADDYITKPFSSLELQARVKAVLRRAGKVETMKILTCGKLSLDITTGEAKLRGKSIKLTPIETKILGLLISSPGKPIPAKSIAVEIWGPQSVDFAYNYLKVYIKYLRSKLEEDPKNPKIILTERGWGYKLQPPT